EAVWSPRPDHRGGLRGTATIAPDRLWPDTFRAVAGLQRRHGPSLPGEAGGSGVVQGAAARGEERGRRRRRGGGGWL
ncbi:MAG: hypothetical protein AVDCRST_MAG88-2133, partial [uncultured Thermomicrobiales bacterium]